MYKLNFGKLNHSSNTLAEVAIEETLFKRHLVLVWGFCLFVFVYSEARHEGNWPFLMWCDYGELSVTESHHGYGDRLGTQAH